MSRAQEGEPLPDLGLGEEGARERKAKEPDKEKREPQKEKKEPDKEKKGPDKEKKEPQKEKKKPDKKKDPAAAAAGEHELEEAVVLGQRRAEATAAARYEVELGKLHIIPRKNAAEQLMLAPGVLTTNHGGEGHAQETFMRGFAAREGQDIEFLVDGVPLNEVSNAHGHGYADLHFMPPEFVRAVDITEGVFDPVQGDFAFAGSADYHLGVADRGAKVTYGLGSFDTHRLLLSYAPKDGDEGTFAGFELYRTSGFGTNRAAQRALGLGRYTDDEGPGGLRWALSAYGYASRYDQAGVLRQDDLALGKLSFFDTYDEDQGGESNRLMLVFDLGVGPDEGRFSQSAFLGFRTMRMRANFTGWLLDTLDAEGNPIDEQRGDLAEMRYEVLTLGSRGDYTLRGTLLGQRQALALGYALRLDHGDTEQVRLNWKRTVPYERDFDRGFTVLNLAGWLRAQVRPVERLALRGGVRVDTFSFGVTDYNNPESELNEGARLKDQTSQAFGFTVNPRVTADLRLWRELHLVASYGQGTRSTDAAALSDNETAPFARAQVVDGGLTFQHGRAGQGLSVTSQLSYSFTQVNKDLLFSPEQGRNVLVGASTRHAALLGTRAQYGTWLDLLLNAGYAHATLDDTGELLPYIPRFVLRMDAAVKGNPLSWRLGRVPVVGRVGIGFTYVPGRPLPYKAAGDPYYLLNLGADVRLWHLSLGLELRNLINLEYRQSEFNYVSNFRGATAVLSKVPMRHFAAGEPFFVMGTLTLHLEDLVRAYLPKKAPKPAERPAGPKRGGEFPPIERPTTGRETDDIKTGEKTPQGD